MYGRPPWSSAVTRLDPEGRLRLFAVLAAVFGLPLLLGQRYGGLDHSLVHLGMQCALRDGDGWMLDAALGGGSPLWAEPQGGVAYPLSWLLLPIQDAELAASLWTVLHIAVAGATAALLGQRMGLQRRGALALGTAHALSGTVLDLVFHGAYIAGAAWIPLAWAGGRGLVTGRAKGRAAAETAAALGLLLLTGELQGFGIATVFVLAELARGRADRRTLSFAGAALFTSVAIGLAQWLPTLGLRSAIARSGGLELSAQTLWSLGMPEALGIVWPGVTTERVTSGASLLHLWTGSPDARVPWNPRPYLGLVGLSLGLAAWAHRSARWPAAAATVLTLLALGDNTPLYGIVETLVPPVGLFRYPAKYFAPASLAWLLAATKLSQDPHARRTVTVALGAAVGVSLVGITAAIASSAALQEAADAFTFGVRTLPGVRLEPGELLVTRGGQATALALLALLVVRRAPEHVISVLVLDLALAVPHHLDTVPPITALDVPRHALGDARSATLCTDPSAPWARFDSPERDWGVWGVTAAQVLRHKANLQQCGGPAVPQHYLSSATAPTVALWREHLADPSTQLQAATALGCTHLATTQPVPGIPVPDETPTGVSPPVTALQSPLPEVFSVAAPVVHSSAEDALAAVLVAPSPEVLAAQLDDPEQLAPDRLPASAASVRVLEDSLTDVVFEVDSPTTVVLRRPWWPGWTATQGTEQLPVLRAAGAQLAVVVSNASSPVTLRYRTRYGRLGAWVGGCGWLLVLALLWVGRSPRSSTHG